MLSSLMYMTVDWANQFLFLRTLENAFLEPTEVQIHADTDHH